MNKIIQKIRLKNSQEVIFRVPVMADAKTMQNYINTLSREKTFIRLQGEQLTLKEETDYLQKQLKKIKEGKAVKILAFIKKEMVAMADIGMKDKIESHIGGFGITVKKEYRGQGIGKKIMELTLSYATKQIKNLEIVTLSVFGKNTVAKKMYQKLGFKKYGLLPKGIKSRTNYQDHIYMYKVI